MGGGLPEEVWHWMDVLSVLARHLELIERQIEVSRCELDQEWRQRIARAGDAWDHIDGAEYEYEKSIVSRVLRNTFLISLFSVHESITKDIARESIPHECPEKVKQLRWLRNFIVHKNGCFFYFSEEERVQQKKEILNISEGIEELDSYVVLSKDFLSCSFRLVKSELEVSMENYTNSKIAK